MKRNLLIGSAPDTCQTKIEEALNVNTWRDRLRLRLNTIKQSDGITQKEVARRVGRSPGLISHWLTGAREPSLEDLDALAKAIGVTSEWLTHGIGPDDPLMNELLLEVSRLNDSDKQAVLTIVKGLKKRPNGAK